MTLYHTYGLSYHAHGLWISKTCTRLLNRSHCIIFRMRGLLFRLDDSLNGANGMCIFLK